MATTKAAQFKALARGTELTLPSGFTVVARRVDVRTMLKTGRIPNTLRPILDRAMQGQQTATEELTKDVLENPEKLDDMFDFVDQVFVDSVIDPKVGPNPKPEVKDEQGNVIKPAEPRLEDVVYPDEVHDNDKMFIMNWAMGGSSDLERFRGEQTAHVERVASVAEAESQAE